MDCDRYMELLSARLDGVLTEAEERELEEHLAACPDCRAAGAQLAALQEAFPELEEVPVPEGFTQSVMERIRESNPQKVIPLFKRPQVRALAGLAACLVVVVGLYGASQLRNQEKMMLMTRSFQHDVMWEEAVGGAGDVSACETLGGEADSPQVNAALVDPEPTDAPQIAAYSASSQTDGTPGQRAAPNPAADGLEDDYPLMEGTTTLERMPEGAAELIPPETAVIPTDDRRGSIYLDLPLEVLDQIERLAQEQGIGVTAERCSAPGVEVRYNLEILQPDQ